MRPLRKKNFFSNKKNVPASIKLEGWRGKAFFAASLTDECLNLPVTAGAFDEASTVLVEEVDGTAMDELDDGTAVDELDDGTAMDELDESSGVGFSP